MSPNKMPRLCKRSSKQKRSDTQDALKTTPAPPEHPATPAAFAYSELWAPSQGHLGFPDRVYLLASVLFQNIHLEKPVARKLVNYGNKRRLPLPEVKIGEHRTAYELAFNTLKYQDFLEAIITDSFGVAPPVSHDDTGLFVVMLYDFQDRKFLPRQRWENQESIPAVTLVEKAVLGFKTKLAASLARHRIRRQLPSIECFLPDTVKIRQERSERLPTYAWVNTLKSSPEEVQRALTSEGFREVPHVGQLVGRTFCWDRHCGDTLAFPASSGSQLRSTGLLRDHKLIIQDKPCGLGPNAVSSVLPEDADVLVSGRFSGLTVSHAAALAARRAPPAAGARRPAVYVCLGDLAEDRRAELRRAVAAAGCENVTLLPEDFQALGANDKRLQRPLVVLLTPECSLSALSNPVEIVLQENRDPDLLQELSRGSVGPRRLTTLAVGQRRAVDHALKFPKVSAVVYSTYSSLAEENEEVVMGALQKFKSSSGQAGEPEAAGFSLSPTPFSMFTNDEGLQNEDNFFMLEPSEESNGCFLAVLKRDPVVQETPRDVILKACARGILDGIGPNCQLSETSESRDRSEAIQRQDRALDPEPRPAITIQAKPPRAKSSSGVSHQLVSHTQASLAKAKRQQMAKTSKGTGPVPAAPLRQTPNAASASPSKPDHGTFKKRICRASALRPAASRSAADAPPAVRPHLEPKQVELTLPVVQFRPLLSRGWHPSQKEPPSGFNPSKSVASNSKHLFGTQNK